MLLTPDQQQRFRDHLRTASVREDCLLCHHPIDLAAVAELATNGFAFPVVRCVCPHCAFVADFSGQALDLVPLQPPVKAATEPTIEAALMEVARAINGRAVN